MSSVEALDQAKVEAFMGKVIGDLSGGMTVLLAYLGDRFGLFNALAEHGPATAGELASRAGVDERYVAEWLPGLRSAGYLEYAPETGRYSLPPEHAVALASEGGPFFVGGAFQILPELVRPVDRLADAFRAGGGLSQADYDPRIWEAMERFTAGWFENRLIPEGIPALPAVRAKLEAGGTLADVGCGSGRALVKLAQAFPTARFAGYDSFPGQVERARENVNRAGLSDRIRIELFDAAAGLPETYDVITTFDVVHDAVDPLALLRAIRQALAPDGRYVVLEVTTADDPQENVGPVATMFYAFSIYYCMTTSLAHGGAALGTHGVPEAKLRELCLEAGFSSVRRTEVEDPFDVLYEVLP